MVATHSDRAIRAFYFSHCDGHTRNSEDVWVQALPYCRSVPCIKPYPELFGHGVGMCQKGAIAMGETGHDYEEILKHYYTGIDIHKPAVAEKPEPSRKARLITAWIDEPEPWRQRTSLLARPRAGLWMSNTALVSEPSLATSQEVSPSV
jgi:hypothetical protein